MPDNQNNSAYLPPALPFPAVRKTIDHHIFQAYDIRAEADKYLSGDIIYYLGKAYATFLRRTKQADSGELWVSVGGGIRLSTERIRTRLIGGILSAGVNVYDIGISTTPELYFSIPFLNADGGINITASHNGPEYNGLKQAITDEDGFITSINDRDMLEIKRIILEGDFLDDAGKVKPIQKGRIARYHNLLVKSDARLGREIWTYLLAHWKKRGLMSLLDTVSRIEFPETPDESRWKEIRVTLGLLGTAKQPVTAVNHPFEGLLAVIDFGNGSAGHTARIYQDLGADVTSLYKSPDGTFPAHTPDPIKEENRPALVKATLAAVRREELRKKHDPQYIKKEVVAFGFDEDADRVIFVRPDGLVVEGDRSLCIQAKFIIAEHRRQGKSGRPRFIGEVKFSRVVGDYIDKIGGEFIMSPTGFAFIKGAVKAIVSAVNCGLPKVEVNGKVLDLKANRETVALAAELSGHQMAGHEENWIFDDAALAAAKMLAVIAAAKKRGQTFIELDEEIPRYPVSPEINIKLPTNLLSEKKRLVDSVLAKFTELGHQIDTTDGGIVMWQDKNGKWLGQALVRKSNTQPMVICRVEGIDRAALERVEHEFFGVLAGVSTPAVPRIDLASDSYVKRVLERV